MNTTTRPERRDDYGTDHAPSCDLPGWSSRSSSVRGWTFLTCTTCGVVRLARSPEATR